MDHVHAEQPARDTHRHRRREPVHSPMPDRGEAHTVRVADHRPAMVLWASASVGVGTPFRRTGEPSTQARNPVDLTIGVPFGRQEVIQPIEDPVAALGAAGRGVGWVMAP
jgi:hypothetical protein